jgi:hypothetical protein
VREFCPSFKLTRPFGPDRYRDDLEEKRGFSVSEISFGHAEICGENKLLRVRSSSVERPEVKNENIDRIRR